MGNAPRYVPEGTLVEVTTRTLHGRFLLRPSRELNDIVCGILARAVALYDVGVVDFKVLSNHMHLLLLPTNAQQLAGFMCYLNGNLAKEAGRLHGWRERLWSRRYRAIVVSDESDAQVDRLRYLLEQGCKEGLVRSPREWPGASGTESLLTGEPIRGWWFDRSAEYEARRRGESVAKYAFAEEVGFELAPLPCWRDLPVEDRRRRVEILVREIETRTRKRLSDQGRSPLGRRRILGQHPHDAPPLPSRSPAPRFHAATPSMRKALERDYYEFRVWYRQASEELRAGRLDCEFPPGCFPPRLPFQARRAPPFALPGVPVG
jgi:REP element-mobilizing transposase RayT